MADNEEQDSQDSPGEKKESMQERWGKLATWQKAGVLIAGAGLAIAVLMYWNRQQNTGVPGVPAPASDNGLPQNMPGQQDQFPPVPLPPVPGTPNPPTQNPPPSPAPSPTGLPVHNPVDPPIPIIPPRQINPTPSPSPGKAIFNPVNWNPFQPSTVGNPGGWNPFQPPTSTQSTTPGFIPLTGKLRPSYPSYTPPSSPSYRPPPLSPIARSGRLF